MAEKKYVTKDEFNELVIKYNDLCEKLSELNLRQTISFDDYLFNSDDEDLDNDIDEDLDNDIDEDNKNGSDF